MKALPTSDNTEKGLAEAKEALRQARASDPELDARWRRVAKIVGQALAREHMQILTMRAKGETNLNAST